MNLHQKGLMFWKKFSERSNLLKKALENNDQVELKHLLDQCNHDIGEISGGSVEVSICESEFCEITFLSKGVKTAQFIHSFLKKIAPKKILELWIINAFAQPLSDNAYKIILKIGDKAITGLESLIYYEINTELKMLDIEFFHPNLVGVELEQQKKIALFLLEQFIGECEMEARIASINVIEQASENDNVCYLPNFYEDICDIVSEQEWTQYSDPTQIYNVFKIEQALEKIDIRYDMKIITTKHAELQAELLNKQYDICKNIIALGGQCGYFYYEVKETNEKEALLRQDIERQLNELLNSLDIATSIGGAIGEKYAYIDFIIFDFERFSSAVDKIKATLPFDIDFLPFLKV